MKAIADGAPEVSLEGAPKTVELKTLESLELSYEASDDNGLKQLDVVMRAGDREDRRVLARLDGATTFERGNHVLSPRDPFLRRMYLPVHVTIEARDNDPVAGPKWGRSAAITLIPPVVGEPEALRYAALADAHGALLDYLAWQSERSSKKDAERPAREESDHARRAADTVRKAADKTYGGLGVPAGLRAFILGQMRVLERSLRPGESRIRRTEDVVLALDAVLRMLSTKDAQSVAKRLADVVEEIADGARQARETEQSAAGLARLDAALSASRDGAGRLLVLGMLGKDLGEHRARGLGARRAFAQGRRPQHTPSWPRVIWLRDSVARIRSFGSAQRGGVESGAPSQGGGGGRRALGYERPIRRAGRASWRSSPPITRTRSARSNKRCRRPKRASISKACAKRPSSERTHSSSPGRPASVQSHPRLGALRRGTEQGTRDGDGRVSGTARTGRRGSER